MCLQHLNTVLKTTCTIIPIKCYLSSFSYYGSGDASIEGQSNLNVYFNMCNRGAHTNTLAHIHRLYMII